jgi:hypothetical protein
MVDPIKTFSVLIEYRRFRPHTGPHKKARTSASARMDWNRLRYRPGQPEGHYESYYLRANEPGGARALWIRYTLFNPEKRPDDALGELWAIAFDGERGHVAVKSEFPLRDCALPGKAFTLRIGAAELDSGALRGEARSGGHRIAWDLRYAGGQEPLLFMPRARYDAAFPVAKSVVSRPLARFEGTLQVDDVTWTVAQWPGSQNHNWGRRHTDRYAFGQVCGFEGAPDSFLEVASARVRVGPVLTPTLTPLVLRHGGCEYAITALGKALRARGARRGFDWRFGSRTRGVRIAGRIQAEARDFVALRYYNPPGGVKICLNTKIARCELDLRHADGRRERLVSARGALFEILGDAGDPRVPVVI